MKYTQEQITLILQSLEGCKDVNGRYNKDAMCLIADLRDIAKQYLEVLDSELHNKFILMGE